MELVERILRGVSDSKLLSAHPEGTTPLGTLITSYRNKAQHDDNLPIITDSSTGADLKQAISKMEPEDQVVLLHAYTVATNGPVPNAFVEDPKVIEERKLKHWLIKAAFYMFAPIPPLIAGAVVVIGVKSGVMPDSAVTTGFMSFATEVLKLIFSMP